MPATSNDFDFCGFERTPRPKQTTASIGAGDNDTIDLHLRILDPQNNVVAADNLVEPPNPKSPSADAAHNYTIQMRLYILAHNAMCIGRILAK